MGQEGTQFEILNRVDVGGMAEIFRARNLDTGEVKAIKRILPNLSRKKDFISMFIDEAAVCLQLHHPDIVQVDQIGLMDGALFLSMEFVDGANLREILSFANKYNFFLPVHEAVRIAIHVLDGLEYAHHCCNADGTPLNLIHRDVSPPNILLGYNGDVKITDFGLVKSKAQVSHTSPGLIKGKFSYLSPEAAYGESIDLRSDIYSMGIILWEMLTARPLYTAPVEMDILDLVRKSIVPDIMPINPAVPWQLEEIVRTALARNREDRYQSARAFADDLRGFMQSIGNPKSELGDIVASIKPPVFFELDPVDIPLDDLGSTYHAHSKSRLIPLDVLDKRRIEETLAESASPKVVSVTHAVAVENSTPESKAALTITASEEIPQLDPVTMNPVKAAPVKAAPAKAAPAAPATAPQDIAKSDDFDLLGLNLDDCLGFPDDLDDKISSAESRLKHSHEGHVTSEMVRLDLPLESATHKTYPGMRAIQVPAKIPPSQIALLVFLIALIIALLLLNLGVF